MGGTGQTGSIFRRWPAAAAAAVSFVLAACGGTSTVADDQPYDGGSSDAKADSNGNPCEGLGCAQGPGRLTLHVVDSTFMQPVASPTFTESGQMLQPTCVMGDAGACGAWEFDGLAIGMHTITVHAPNALDGMVTVSIEGPAGCCGFGPDVEKTLVLSALSPGSLCTSTGGTVEMGSCCNASNDFPDLCTTGACGCSPQNSKMVQICSCPMGKCYDPMKGCM